MRDFAAIDFETANGYRTSVCSVGVVIVEDGEIADTYYHLIQPTPNFYTQFTTQVHGLTRLDTDGQPLFPEIWAEIVPKIKYLPLVAHNKAFDENCLKAVFQAYGMAYSRLSVFLYAIGCPSGVSSRRIVQLSVADRCRTLWIRFEVSSPRTC